MFDKDVKLRLRNLEDFYSSFETRISRLEKDYEEFLEWRKMKEANKEAAAKQGHFYISADDVALLERLIQEVNSDPDLAVMMTTAQGTTLTLRTHPQPKFNTNYTGFNGVGD